MTNSQILRRKYDSDAEYDPASLLQEREAERPKYSKNGWKNADPDSARGLAWCFSRALPAAKWGIPSGLDLAELKHVTKYMACLLEEHSLSPDRVRAMIGAYAEMTRSQSVPYPVGKFWAMRRLLMEKSAPTEKKDYEGWLQPNVHHSDRVASYLGWAQ